MSSSREAYKHSTVFTAHGMAGASVMNRLSVRLSIVGAVLTLGASAIAHSVLSNREAPSPDGDPGTQQVAQADPAQSPTPIRADENADNEPVRSLQPPPASAFTRSPSLRTVSHEDPADTADEGAQAVPTADPISTLGANDAQPSAYSAYAPTSSVTAGNSNDSAHENVEPADPSKANGVDASVADDQPTRPADSIVPEAPQYGTASDRGQGSSAASSPADRPAARPGAPVPPPASGFPLGNPVNPAANTGGAFPTSSSSVEPYPSMAPSPLGPTGAGSFTSPPAAASFSGTTAADTARSNQRSGATLSPGPDMTRASIDVHSWTGGSFPGDASASRNTEAFPATARDESERGAPRSLAANPGASVPAGDAAAGAQATLSSNVPGDRALEGQQSPAIVLEKTAPDEIQVERKATFQIRVRNVGNAAAHNVVVIDQVPRGTEYIDAVPACTHTPDGLLVWNLRTLQASEEVILAVNLLPKVAGEIGSVAQATFQTQASVRTICTKPQLALELTVPEQVLIGTSATLDIVVTNTGSGAATNVVIEEDVPEGFTHAAGRQLEHEIGTLLPQESRKLSLVLDATKPGVYDNRLTVRGEGNLHEQDVRKIEVATPKLEITMQGPTLRYLDRQATYVVRMANPGTAPARNVELVTYLPKGMKYVTSDNQGQYDSQTHAVYWSLEELPAEKQGDVHVTVLPIEPGNHKLKADGHAELGLQHTCEHEVVVEGLAELAFSVADLADPIEVGSETTYEVRVHNRGSKADSDIRVVAELPPGMVPATGDGPVPATVQGQRVVFSSLARLAPDEEAVFKIHATGEATGDHVIRVQLQSTELRVPVTKEEITRVYTDQ
jgi:uncharacterized repeat protein (TIGR01451 family)